MARRLAEHPNAGNEGSPFWQLREALRADGFDARLDYEAQDDSEWPPTDPRLLDVRFLPIDNPDMPLSEAISALEDDLKRLGLQVALNCYRQAVDALVEGRHESANGQTRALLEEVVVQAAATVGFVRTKQGDGGQAIGYLINGDHLSKDGAGKFVQGLWGMTHTNGSHPGTTTAGEARFRHQTVTAAARYLIDQFFS